MSDTYDQTLKESISRGDIDNVIDVLYDIRWRYVNIFIQSLKLKNTEMTKVLLEGLITPKMLSMALHYAIENCDKNLEKELQQMGAVDDE